VNKTQRWIVPAALGAAGVVTVGAVWFGSMRTGASRAESRHAPPSAAPAKVSIADGTTGLAPGSALTVTAPPGERVGNVMVTDGTESVTGTYNANRTQWTSSEPFRAGAKYAVTAVTLSRGYGTGIKTTSFSTAKATSTMDVDVVAPADGSVTGVAQPVVLQFAQPVTNRAAIEQAMTVATVPPQVGHWSWLSSTRVDYRPETFWKSGTKISVQVGLGGLELAGGKFGTENRTVNFTVGRDQETVVDLASDKATVTRDGQTLRTFPITGGMPGLDTWGGTFAVIDKSPTVHMDSETVGLGDAYSVDVQWAVHLTDSGTYLHSAPWSVGDQGEHNVSHGCIGASPENAEWFFDNTIPGDVVKVVHSPRQGNPGNGFADWNESWAQWLKGSSNF
jgi:lipoprotein-anchoring transpeptidase ErfK/SrfK